jgi:putative oxidoreductase
MSEQQTRKSGTGVHVLLWVIQIVLILLFAFTGFMKSFMPIAELAEQMPWVSEVPAWMVRIPGVAELIGSLGLLLPTVLRKKPGMSIVAAFGLMMVMIIATAFHYTREEYILMIVPIALILLCSFLAVGRTTMAPYSRGSVRPNPYA